MGMLPQTDPQLQHSCIHSTNEWDANGANHFLHAQTRSARRMFQTGLTRLTGLGRVLQIYKFAQICANRFVRISVDFRIVIAAKIYTFLHILHDRKTPPRPLVLLQFSRVCSGKCVIITANTIKRIVDSLFSERFKRNSYEKCKNRFCVRLCSGIDDGCLRKRRYRRSCRLVAS